jgi:ATP adenylyltransferase
MSETNDNLWAPWRMEYIDLLADKEAEKGCFLCRYAAEPDQDVRNHVIWRTERCLTTFNSFPYNNGHLLIAPLEHQGSLSDFDDAVLAEMMLTARDAQRLLKETTDCHGFNVGMNVGRCAGAGLPDHLHLHIVPRWGGDTNFMPVLAGVRVIPQSIQALYDKMRAVVGKLGLPPMP